MHSAAEDKFDFREPRSKWDEDWDKSKGAFPFSDKLGEIGDKIGSTIDDTINMFRNKDRDDSPDRFRSGPPGRLTFPFQITWKLLFCQSSFVLVLNTNSRNVITNYANKLLTVVSWTDSVLSNPSQRKEAFCLWSYISFCFIFSV